MIKRELFGEVSLKIDGFDASLLTQKLHHTCKVISLYTKSDSIYLTTIGTHEKRVRDLCEKSSCVCETLERRGAVYTVKKYIKRYGILVGALLVTALMFYMSNIVMKIEINGVSDEAVISEIKSILREDGLSAGAYIPSLNFLQLANDLFSTSDNVAWASIGSSGSVVYVNISTPTHPTESENQRIPCNLVASRDAVIVNVEVMVGQLNVLLGDAVYKGQMLVSGIIEHRSGVTKYYHSYARITGRYEEEMTFKQDYIEEAMTSGKSVYRRSLNFFELSIPLPGDILDCESAYSVKSHTTPIKLFGFTLPFSITTEEYTERHSDIKTYSTAEAMKVLREKLENYEQNMLKDVTIIDRQVTETQNDEGVSLTVKYVLEGEIGEISEIYVK